MNIGLYAADLWKKHLNINAALQQMPTAQWNPIKKKGEFDVGIDSVVSATNLAIEDYLAIFTSPGGNNFGQWQNQEYSSVVAQINAEQDPGKKNQLFKKAQEILYRDLPTISLLQSASGCAWRPDLMTGWPAKKGIVMQKAKTTQVSIDHMWLAGTEDAKRWMK